MSSSDLWQEDSSAVEMKKKTKEMKMRVVKVHFYNFCFERPLNFTACFDKPRVPRAKRCLLYVRFIKQSIEIFLFHCVSSSANL